MVKESHVSELIHVYINLALPVLRQPEGFHSHCVLSCH